MNIFFKEKTFDRYPSVDSILKVLKSLNISGNEKSQFDEKVVGKNTNKDLDKEKMTWENIFGYFDFQDIYQEMVDNAKDGSHFIEIGIFCGKSTAYMAMKIKESGKNIKFDAIDTFKGSDELEHQEFIKEHGDIYDIFIANMKACEVLEYINVIKMDSVEASRLYKDETLDFIFIDASHDYESVKNDINAWYRKVKSGGILSGHDYNTFQSVNKAVDEFFGDKI